MPSNTYNTSNNQKATSNVVNLFTQQTIQPKATPRIIRVCAELSGIRMLYSNDDNSERLVAVPILCWALTEGGEIIGLVPWLDEVIDCETVEENFQVKWEGFYNHHTEEIFFHPPEESAAILTTSARFIESYELPSKGSSSHQASAIIQEFADPIGTHALLVNPQSDSLLLTSVISWTLNSNGQLHAMLADDTQIEKLPVLPSDNCLYDAHSDESFKCFFQRDIAEQIREQNPETMQAIEKLFVNQ